MLQEIRERAQGWVAWAIVILITIPFAFWGIDSYFGGGAEPVVAEVNGNEITERAFSNNVNRTRASLRERLGDAYDPAVFGEGRLREQVLDEMIRDAVLIDASEGMGLAVSDQAVRSAILAEPAFQRDGAFSKESYERILSLQGLTPTGYENLLRQQLLLTQIPRAVRDTAFSTPALAQEGVALLRQQRQVRYLVLPRADFVADAEPTEDEIARYYDANQDRFRTPEQVRLSYLLLDGDALGSSEELIDDDELRRRYEGRIDEFVVPERRRLRHILVAIDAETDADAARERAEQARERVLSGEDFAAVAAEVSDDPGTKDNGGEFGPVGRSSLDPAFAEAAFALPAGELSEPVRSRFGYHVVEVLGVEGGAPKPFDEVREQLAAEVSAEGAEGAYFEQAEQLAILAYESPDSLIPASEALSVELATTDWIARDGEGAEGPFANPKVLSVAFSDDVLVAGNNSEVLEPDPERLQALVLRVDDHREPALRPLDEVRDEIVDALEQEQSAARAAQAARSLVGQLEAGAPLDEVAGERPVEDAGLVGRTAPGIPPAVLELAFSAPRPPAAGTSYVSGENDTGDGLIVAVSEVIDGTEATASGAEAALATERRFLADTLARAEAAALVEALEARATIEREPVAPEDEP